jgi:uncharacterized protein YjiS (DUF1127 family)
MTTSTTAIHKAQHTASASTLREGIMSLLGVVERQRQRRALLDLDDRMLNDIGKSRQETLDEASKPFWK